MTIAAPRPIDPLRSAQTSRYADEVVTVTRCGQAPVDAVRTEHFATWTVSGRVHVLHELPPESIDNDLAGLVADELFAPGWLSGSDVFERVMTGIVLTSAPHAADAWELFYRNTLSRLAEPGDGATTYGSIDAYAPVYAHAKSLASGGSVLELGCCFGFLSLQLADTARVTASDVSLNTVRLLTSVAPRLGHRIETIICDAARVPRPDASYDTVLAIHLLEHLEPDHGLAVLQEMLRLARRRIVVAVPFEDEPTAAYGHVRVFSLDDLGRLGELCAGWSFRHYEHHGGWLVLDREGSSGHLRK